MVKKNLEVPKAKFNVGETVIIGHVLLTITKRKYNKIFESWYYFFNSPMFDDTHEYQIKKATKAAIEKVFISQLKQQMICH